MVLRRIIASILGAVATLFRAIARSLDELRELTKISSEPAYPLEALQDPPPISSLLQGVATPNTVPPFAYEDNPGDYNAWYNEQLELRIKSPGEMDPSFLDHEAWVRKNR